MVRAVGKPQQHSAPLIYEPQKHAVVHHRRIYHLQFLILIITYQNLQSLTAKMTSLYNQSVPVLVKYLNNLAGIVKKGQVFADEKGVKHEEVIGFRLVADMRG